MASSNDNDVVNSVLSFWFGEAIFSQSTSMSPRNHPTIEQCITKQYKTLWFSSSKAQTEADHTIKNRFGKLLSDAEQGLLNGWIAEPLSLCALIVVLDQFSRHIYRNVERPPQNDAKALELSELMLKRRWHLYLPVPMEVFSLMPLRHSPTIPRLERVLEEIERRSTSEKASSVLLEKFRRTTVGRLESLKDSSADLCTSSISSSNDDSDENDDILERHPFIADEIKLGKHTLVHCMQQFISTKMVAKRNEIVLAVSLSGGVDSMVIARILVYIRDTFASKMKNSSTASTTSTSSSSSSSTSTSSSSSNKECHLQRLHVIALHIDYGNRNESAKEASYVESWCKQFNITFYKRRIDEVKRGVTSRDEYEKKSRRIRYGFYKEILSKYQESQGIFFGHHRGDVQENVLSNMMRRSSPLNLSGMTSVGLVEGVRIFRPFLEYNKDIIYQFAHEFGVPYFKDTTPKWSVRGKLRNQLMP
jgi:tRNA(Ile)-lysidine synthetase-like protein